MGFGRGELIAVALALSGIAAFTWFAMRSSPVVLVGTAMQVDPSRSGEPAPAVTITYTAIERTGRRSAPVTLTAAPPFRIAIPGDSIEGTASCPSPNVQVGVDREGSGHTRSASSHGADGATFSFSGGSNRLPLWMTLAGNAFCVALLAVFLVLRRFLKRRRLALQP